MFGSDQKIWENREREKEINENKIKYDIILINFDSSNSISI